LIFEVRGLPTRGYLAPGQPTQDAKGKDFKPNLVGNVFYGPDGYVVCPSYSAGVAFARDGSVFAQFAGDGDHYGNFVEAVRLRLAGDTEGGRKHLNADIEEGHLSSALCHLGNISYRLGRKANMADEIKCFTGCQEAQAALTRMRDHLTDNKVDLKEAVGLVGTKLTIDPKTEKFAAASDGADVKTANDMLFREYRKGFEIADKA
jgi:hypothetical protein